MADISGTWHKVLESELLQRSSHAMLVIGGKAYVFGGELRPRQPVDNELHIVAIDSGVYYRTLIPIDLIMILL